MYEIRKTSHSTNVGGETMTNSSNNSSMKMRVPGAKQAIDKMKYEMEDLLQEAKIGFFQAMQHF